MGLADGVAWERDYGAPERRTVAGQQSEADWIKECTEKISNAIGGGSELFVRHGEGFRLDVDFVCKRIVEMRERHHEAKRSCVLAARQAEALQRENAELRAVMKECHAALNMMISPDDISGSTVLGAFAAAKSAEARARALLGGENAGN